MAKHKQTKATDISPKVRERVLDRDGKCCVICGQPHSLELAHYIGRAQGGLGIPENLVTLCKTCHTQYDNGNFREIHGEIIRNYLKGWYLDWNEKKLVYNKYAWLEAINETESTT